MLKDAHNLLNQVDEVAENCVFLSVFCTTLHLKMLFFRQLYSYFIKNKMGKYKLYLIKQEANKKTLLKGTSH